MIFNMVTLENNIWKFGSSELIALISAIATFLAVIVSLFLALKSKTINYKVHVNHEMMGLRITNTGDAKFLINAFGVCINGKYYMNPYECFCKVLPISRQTNQTSRTFQEHSMGYVLLEPGDVVEIGLQYFDSSLLKGNVHLCIAVSGKIKKYRLKADRITVKVKPEMNNYRQFEKNDIKNIGFYLRNH